MRFVAKTARSRRLLIRGKLTPNDGVGASGTLNVLPLPEPGTWAMVLAGLFTIGFIAKRRLD
jgi:hypothetical protein